MKFKDINIDFLVLSENKDLRILSIFDTSSWQFLTDKRTVIDIKTPGSKTFVRNFFTKNAINNFNSVNLNINCFTNNCGDVELIPLPDGVYTIKLLTDGNFIEERQFFRTTELEHEFKNYVKSITSGCETDECAIKESMYFLFYMEALKSYTIDCNLTMAQKYYELAEKLIRNTKKSKCKTCN